MLYLPDCGACMMSVQLVGGSLLIPGAENMTHGGSLGFGFYSDCEWTNDECPAQCSTEHDEPDPDDNGLWECPETGDRYHYCSDCGWDRHTTWSSYPSLVHGEWYCDPGDHGYSFCDDCEEYCDSDDMHYIEGRYDDRYVCRSCYQDHEDEQERRTATPPARTCRTCNTPETFLDELTERFVCKHLADELRNKRKPVMAVAA